MATASKYDSFIYDFLSINKEVSFEKIGTLSFDANAKVSEGASLFEGANYQFEFNRKEETSAALIDFIAEKIQKNRTLIESDIYSYLEQARELMNTGKPWVLFGVGIFSINMSGIYQFAMAEFNNEENKPTKKENTQKSTSKKGEPKNGNRAAGILSLIMITALIAGLIWVAYEYFLKDKFTDWSDSVVSNSQLPKSIDTADLSLKSQSINTPPLNNSNDSILYGFVFETTPSLLRARERVNKLRSFGNNAGYDSLSSDSGKLYNIFIISKALPSDTTSIKDSLAKFFNKPIKVQFAVQ